MANIDVSDLLADPDFVDDMKIISRKSSENSYGENKLAEVCTDTVGSIQPVSGKTLMRLPEALRVLNLKSFWVRGEIIAAAPGKYTDQLLFKGVRYNIQTVNDWTNWGEGWCEGTCIAEPLT
jgi:hypothetical protein